MGHEAITLPGRLYNRTCPAICHLSSTPSPDSESVLILRQKQKSHNSPDYQSMAKAHINLNGLGLQLPSSSGSSAPPTPRRPLTPAAPPTGIVVFSGGSAANNLVDVFESVREANQCTLSYVIPISDNGGSSSEIIRVFGGPGMFPFHVALLYAMGLVD